MVYFSKIRHQLERNSLCLDEMSLTAYFRETVYVFNQLQTEPLAAHYFSMSAGFCGEQLCCRW